MGMVGNAQAGTWQDEILGKRTIKSYHGTFLHAEDSWGYVDLRDPPAEDWEHWYIEEKQGKATLKTARDWLFASASHFNLLKLKPYASDWELWTPVKNDNGTWSFLGFHGKWMSARDDKSVIQVAATTPGPWEQFVLEEWSVNVGNAQTVAWQNEIQGKRTIKSYHGTFLRGDGWWTVDLKDPPAEKLEHWYIEEVQGKAVLKMAEADRFAKASHFDTVKLAGHTWDWELWTPIKNDNGTWSFLGFHGKWMSGRDDKSVIQVAATTPGIWEQFVLEEWQ